MSQPEARRTLVVTNDYPPRVGGIQSYVRDFLATQDPDLITVFASTQDAQAAAAHDRGMAYEVIRWPRSMMLPTPATAQAMAELIRERGIHTVWFAAAAPLALMAGQARAAGARRIIASTHGHEVGWSMLPVARQMLGRIGAEVDVVTYVSEYTRSRFATAFGSHPEFRHLPSGVDVSGFRVATPQQRTEARRRLDLPEQAPLIVCISRMVPRKGQDKLIEALPQVLRHHPDALLLLVGSGRIEGALRKAAAPLGESVRFTGRLSDTDMADVLAASDIFAMPARTRGGGLDVEGLGIVYLEAQACGLPVVAGSSGGAPETVTPASGVVVDGRDVDKLASVLVELLDDPERRARMGAAGRVHVESDWTWTIMGERLSAILQG